MSIASDPYRDHATVMIETMPIAATIHTRAGRVGLVHPARPPGTGTR